MQRVPASATTSHAALGSAAFAALAVEDVAPEDVLFHKVMTLASVRRRAAANRARKKAKKAKQKGSDDGEDVLPDDDSSSGEDGAASDDSAAEDAFLDGEETLLVRPLPAFRTLAAPFTRAQACVDQGYTV